MLSSSLSSPVDSRTVRRNPGLRNVVIGDGVTDIPEGLFYGHEKLATVTFGDNIKTIGDSAFQHCHGMTNIVLPEGLHTIGAYAFDWSGITSVKIPVSLKTVGVSAFGGCSRLASVTIDDLSAWMKIDFAAGSSNPISNGGANNSIGKLEKCDLFAGGKLVTDLVIPDDITEIKPYTFYNYKNIESVTVKHDISSVGTCAFWFCENLMDVSFRSCVAEIGAAAFSGCENLDKMIFAGDAPTIGENVFARVTTYTSGGEKIYHDVFTTVRFPGNDKTWTKEIKQNYGGTGVPIICLGE